jgi:hypothetical protein
MDFSPYNIHYIDRATPVPIKNDWVVTENKSAYIIFI